MLYSLDHSEVFTELYGEEEREEVDRGDQEDKRGMSRRETNPASNQFLRCSLPWNTQRFTELDREEMGEKRDRGHLVRKRRVQRRRQSSQASNLTLM